MNKKKSNTPESPRFQRDLSWLSFNARVLQEASSTQVPLLERLRFLAIFSSNLDEFYRVRVASIRQLKRLRKKYRKKLGITPKKMLKQIHEVVDAQQQAFGTIFQQQILPELEQSGIFILHEEELKPEQIDFVKRFFDEKVQPEIQQMFLGEDSLFLKDRQICFAVEVKMGNSTETAIIEIPTQRLPRFIVLPDDAGRHTVMFLDDIVRMHLTELFPEHTVVGAYAIKLSRDADLYIEDEFSGDLVEKIRKSLKKRDTGIPSRFLFDSSMPENLLSQLSHTLGLEPEDLVAGGRYHNFNDFFGFPLPDNSPESLEFPNMESVAVPELDEAASMFDIVHQRDVLLHFPFQDYGYVIRMLREAAEDPKVKRIRITLYRVAADSSVAKALILAKKKGKEITVFLEAKARFDEASNLYWYDQMKAAGIKVISSLPGLKVHAKLFEIEREEEGGIRHYAYFGTGNFNEKSAKIYTDFGLMTSHPGFCAEMRMVFEMLQAPEKRPEFQHLLVAPHEMQNKFMALIDAEIQAARAGQKAEMWLKMNSLEDPDMIEKLYSASRAGVKTHLLVRGICCLVPGLPGISENIEVRSILDRYLEHSRVYMFHNKGNPHVYLASADWMTRNLKRRIEVAFPIIAAHTREMLMRIMHLHFNDNTKARMIDPKQKNEFVSQDKNNIITAQLNTYDEIRNFINQSS